MHWSGSGSSCDGEDRRGWHRVEVGEVRSLPNNGNGDCLFQAIAHQLEGAYQAPQLRQLAADYIRDNMMQFYDELVDLGRDMVVAGEMPAEFLNHPNVANFVLGVLRLPWTWAGSECIAALARFLRRPIRVYLENGPAIVFNPVVEEGPALRILHRFGGEGRRTHYESVLAWRQASSAGVQVEGENASACSSAAAVSEPAPLRRSSRLEVPSASFPFRRQDFSDPEEVPEDTEERVRKHIKCRLCPRRGRYALLYCGHVPFCGTCIRQWFIENNNECLYCGEPVHGWSKVFNNNR